MRYIYMIFGWAYMALIFSLGLLISLLLPIMSIIEGKDMIVNGYVTATGNWEVLMALIFIYYLSLRFKSTRMIYGIFPWLYEYVEISSIACIFTTIGYETVRYGLRIIEQPRNTIYAIAFVVILIGWRIFFSIFYYKKPIVPFIERDKERLRVIDKTQAEEEGGNE